MRKISYILPFLFCLAFLSGCADNNNVVTVGKTVIKGNPINGVQEIETVYNLTKALMEKYDSYFNDTYIQIANTLDLKAPQVGEFKWIDSIPAYNSYRRLECTFNKDGRNLVLRFVLSDPISGLYEAIEYRSLKSGIDIQEFIYSKKSQSAVKELDPMVVVEKFEVMKKLCGDQLILRQELKK